MSESTALATLADPTLFEEKSSMNFRFGRNTWMAIGVFALIAGLLGALMAASAEDQYKVTRTVFVVAGNNTNDNDAVVRFFQEIVSEPGFATDLKATSGSDLTPQQIKGMISTSHAAQSAKLAISTQSVNRDDAQFISSYVVSTIRASIRRSEQSMPIESRIQGPVITEVFANPVEEKVYIPWYIGFVSGAGIAFLLAFIFASFRQYRKPVISTIREVSAALDVPVLARVAAVGDGHRTNPQDAVLAILSAVERLGVNGSIHRLAVVAPESDVERSKLVLALGCAIARNFDQPVVIVDADLENSELTQLVHATDEPGLAECLSGDIDVEDSLLALEAGHTPKILEAMAPPAGMVRIMGAGVDRADAIVSMRSSLHEVLSEMSGHYVVIIDGPSVPGVVPSSQLMAMADATVVFVSEGKTSLRDARFAGDAIRASTTNPTGAVVLTH